MPLDLERMKARSKPRRAACGVALIMDTLDADDLQALNEALANDSVTGTAIAMELDNEGHPVAPTTVQRHRRGECSCVTR